MPDSDLDGVSRAILNREELGSTGIGQGVAVPHTRYNKVNHLIGTIALSRRGVEFAALDGEPVDILFLLISPPNQPGDHLRALENISRQLKDEKFVNFLTAGAVARDKSRICSKKRTRVPPESGLLDTRRRGRLMGDSAFPRQFDQAQSQLPPASSFEPRSSRAADESGSFPSRPPIREDHQLPGSSPAPANKFVTTADRYEMRNPRSLPRQGFRRQEHPRPHLAGRRTGQPARPRSLGPRCRSRPGRAGRTRGQRVQRRR